MRRPFLKQVHPVPTLLSFLPGGPPPPTLVGTGQNPGGSLGETLTFTRATTKIVPTAVDQSTVATVTSGNLAIAPQGLLIEAAHTNYSKNSNGTGGADWTSNTSGTANTGTANSAVAPDGTTTATTVTFNTAGGATFSFWQSSADTTGGAGTYTISVWLKAGTVNSVGLVQRESGGSFQSLQCSLTSSWQRFSITITTAGTLSGGGTRLGGQAAFSVTVGTGTIFMWGMMIDKAPYVRSLVPTSGGIATGNADLATLPATNLPVAAGSARLNFTPLWSTPPSSGAELFDTRPDANGAGMATFVDSAGEIVFVTDQGSGGQNLTSSVLGWVAGTTYSIRLVWGGGNKYIYRNDVLVASKTDGTATMPGSHNKLRIGRAFVDSLYSDAYISALSFLAM